MTEVHHPSNSELITPPPEPPNPTMPTGPGLPPEKPLPPPNGDNRTFWVAVALLGATFVFTLVAMASYVLVIRPQNTAQESTQVAEFDLQGTATLMAAFRTTATALALTKEAPAQGSTNTPLAEAVTQTSIATPTLPLATASPNAGSVAPSSKNGAPAATQTALGVAQKTSLAGPTPTATQTPFPQPTPLPTSTALPETGFADRAGLPRFLGLGLLFLVLIFAARRIRYRA